MKKKEDQIDELIRLALLEEQAVPEGACGRLERQIDGWAAAERRVKPFFRRRVHYWSVAAVAVLLVCLGLFHYQSREATVLADTYADPKEALAATEKALLLLSENLNKGIGQVETAGREVDRMNDILHKQLKTKEIQ